MYANKDVNYGKRGSEIINNMKTMLLAFVNFLFGGFAAFGVEDLDVINFRIAGDSYCFGVKNNTAMDLIIRRSDKNGTSLINHGICAVRGEGVAIDSNDIALLAGEYSYVLLAPQQECEIKLAMNPAFKGLEILHFRIGFYYANYTDVLKFELSSPSQIKWSRRVNDLIYNLDKIKKMNGLYGFGF